MSTVLDHQQNENFGAKSGVVLMDLIIAVGRTECKLPTAALRREGLNLDQEGVKSNDRLTSIFQAAWEGELVTVSWAGEEIELVKPGEIVSLEWARNKLTTLAQWVQELGAHVSRKQGWMFPSTALPEVMRRIAEGQERRDQLLQVLIACHEQAQTNYNQRVNRIGEKLQIVLAKEVAAAESIVLNAPAHSGGVSEGDQARLRQLQRELAALPDLLAKLRSRFPSVSELRDKLVFSNTIPDERMSLVARLQQDAEAMESLIQTQTAEQGAAYAVAIRNGIELASASVRDAVTDLKDEFYSHVASSLATLEGLGDNRKFGPKIAKQVEGHLARLGVLTQLLEGFQAFDAEASSGLSQQALLGKVQEFSAAFAAAAESDTKQIGSGRDALQEALHGFRLGLRGVVLGASLEDLGVGGERLADWVGLPEDNGDTHSPKAEAPITRHGVGVEDLALML